MPVAATKRYPIAEMMDQRHLQARAWHTYVEYARATDKPLYHVRSSQGTTLDLVASIQEARKVADRERGASIYELTPATGQRRIV